MDKDYKIENDVLIIKLVGNVDTNTCGDVEKVINDIIDEAGSFTNINLDIEKVPYVSSAGLRVILRLMRRYPKLLITNVNSEVYDVFDMTGFTQMVSVKKAYKTLSVEGCKEIGRGAKGIIYRYNDDTIIKVYKNKDILEKIEQERELAKKALILGIPTAISYDVVKVGDSFATVFELLDCSSMGGLLKENPEKLDYYACEFAKLLKQINTTPATLDIKDASGVAYNWLNISRSYLGEELYQKIKAMVDRIPNTNTIVHGDYHTNNVMVLKDEMILIDMDTLSRGNKIFDLAIISFSYHEMNNFDENNSASFLGLDKDVAISFYDAFIKYYFDGKSEELINEYNDKISLLALLRVLSHSIKRGRAEELLKQAKERVIDLLAKIDNLVID